VQRLPFSLILLFVIQPALAELVVGTTSRQPFGGNFSLTDHQGRNVKFKYTGVTPGLNNPPNFILLAPSSGVTPALVEFSLNPNVASSLQPGRSYTLSVNFSTVDETPASTSRGSVIFTKPAEPPPEIQAVVNTASLKPRLAPGAMVSIFGTFLSGQSLTATFDETASYPTTLGNTMVTFNDIAAPLLFVSERQVNAIVPYALAGQQNLEVRVSRFFFREPVQVVRLPLQNTAPAIFTVAQDGAGQAVVRQQDADGSFSLNSVDNPALRGAAFELYTTGAGVWNPPVFGDIAFGAAATRRFTTQPVSLTIGGQSARILYAGSSGLQVWGMLQVNAVVPEGVGSGPQPLLLKIGENDSSEQTVTMVIK
jgi:uncharacterized protein (TIGR03437 family)